MPKRSASYMDERRRAILDAADTCLDRDGMGGISTTAICKEARISMGALYTHFPAKDDIVFALAERRAGERRTHYAFDTKPEMCRSILALFDLWIHRTDRLRGEFELLIAKSRDRELVRVMEHTETLSDLRKSLEKLVVSGELPASLDTAAAAEAIEASLIGAALSVVIGRLGVDTARTVLLALLDSLSAENGPMCKTQE